MYKKHKKILTNLIAMRSNSCCFYQRKRKLRSFTTDSLFVHAVRLSVGRCAFPIAGALCMQRFPFGHFPLAVSAND